MKLLQTAWTIQQNTAGIAPSSIGPIFKNLSLAILKGVDVDGVGGTPPFTSFAFLGKRFNRSLVRTGVWRGFF